MQIRNDKERYGAISILLHWIMALLMIVAVAIGIIMTRIPVRFSLYEWHKDIGLSILILVFIRLIWRLNNLSPSLKVLSTWEQLASKCVVLFCYSFMFLIPITGLLLLSASDIQISFLGFHLPELIAPSEYLDTMFLSIHKWLSYLLIIVMIFHIAASFKHLFINKDNIMQRISKL